jgi:TonB family protein
MVHGIDFYFLERDRAARRVSLIAAGLGALGLVLLFGVARTPPAQEALRQTARIGYEGERHFMERVALHRSRVTTREELRDLGQIVARRAQRGGEVAEIGRDRNARPHTRPQIEGPGDSERDLLARALMRAANIPVVQSDELVITHAVTPDYPEPLRERNVEGKVTVQALIDTVGRVVDVVVVSSTGEILFEQAATTAVLQYRFLPYRIAGETREVYAVVRFAFRIY